MTAFIKIKKDTWVNPDAVDRIKQYEFPTKHTSIALRSGEKITIDLSMDQVAKMLVPGGSIVEPT